MSQPTISLKWLAYTYIIGLSLSACYSMLTKQPVPFSFFTFLTLFFSVNHFYGIYIKEADNEISIRPAWVAFFIGMFSYSAFLGTQYPELGSNLFSVSLTLILSIWLIYKLMFGDKRYSA
jgi:putative effector of murein hydrolase